MALTTDELKNSVQTMQSKAVGERPPDGGWGWMVAFGVVLITVSTTAQYSSFGLLFQNILTKLDAQTTGATLIMSFLVATVNCTGLVTTHLLKKASHRLLAYIGCLLFAVGVSLTTLAESIIQIILTYSIIAGTGLGLLAPASYLALNSYFNERLKLAVGLSQIAIAAGFVLCPLFIQYLMDQYGYHGTMLVLGGIAFNSLVGAALFQPVQRHMRKVLITKREQGDGMEEVPLGTLDSATNTSFVAVVDDSNLNMAVVPDEEDDLTKEQATDKENYKTNNSDQMNSEDMECEEHTVISRRGSLVMSTMLDYHSRVKRKPLDEERDGLIYCSTTEIIRETPDSNKSLLYSRPTSVSLTNFCSNVILFDSSLATTETSQKDPLYSALRRRNRQMSRHGEHHPHQWSLLEQIPDDEVEEDSAPVPLIKPKENEMPSIVCRSIHALSDIFDLSLFNDIVFLNVVMGLSVTFVCDTNFFTLYPFYLFSFGISGNDIAIYMAILAGADVIARLLMPCIARHMHLCPRTVYLLACCFSAIARSGTTFVEKSFVPLAVMSGIIGVLHGVTITNLSVVMSKYCSLERFTAAYSLYMIINAAMSLTMGPLVGVLRDSSGSFNLCIHLLSGILIVCVIAWTVECLILWHQARNVKLASITSRVCYR